MRTISAAFTRLARSFDAGVATRVRLIQKSAGWEVDLSDHCGENWVSGVSFGEGLDNNTATFTVNLVRSAGENTLNPLRTSKANRNGTTADPVLALKRLVVVDVQIVPPDGAADADNWIELVRGYVDRIVMNADGISLECRDESARFIDRWQEYERNWPAAPPDALETVIQDVLDTATYDPGPWVPDVVHVVGDLVRPTTHNGYLYRCTTSGTSDATEPATWTTTPGNTVTDNGVAMWTNVGAMPAAAWSAGATARLGQLVRPTTRNGYMYQCTTAGTTHATTEPTWGTTYGQPNAASDNGVVWTLIEDMPDLYVPTSPSWSVTRAAADDYGLPPQSYWDIVRAFVDQIGWDCRWRWVSGSSRRRPTLRSLNDLGASVYTQNGDAGTFEASEYEVTGDVVVAGEHIRNVVEVIYSDGDETGPRTLTRIRLQDSNSIAEFGAQFCQLTMDAAGLINTSAEATKLAQTALTALARPLITLSAKLPFMPWIEPGDGIKLAPRPEDAILAATATSDGTFVAVVQGVSHRTDVGTGVTEVQLQGFYASGADDIEGEMPLQVVSFMNREARARVGKIPTFNRPGDVASTIWLGANYTASPGVKPGVTIALDAVLRDAGGNFNTASYKFTANVAGLYSISASCRFMAPATAGDEVWLSVVAAGAYALQTYAQVGANQVGVAMTLSASGNVWLDAGDTAELALAFDPAIVAPATITIYGGDPQTTFMSVRFVR